MKLAGRPTITFLTLFILLIGIFFIFFQKDGIKIFFDLKSQVLPKEPIVKQNSEAEVSSKTQEPLFQAPQEVKAIYMTSWSASKESYLNYAINIAKNTEINAAVIDIKDYSGYVAFDTKVRQVGEYNAKSIRIKDIGALVKRFHDEGIYLIARISVFQDPLLARARPDLAIHSKAKLSSLWLDDLKLAWIDPGAKEAWDYNIAISKEVISLGFDEINFDYVRFPSDGNLQDMSFPFWNGKTEKNLVMAEFFKYLRQEIPDAKLSVDLFGLTTVSSDDLGVGQVIEDAFEYFDFVCPMLYPSHYAEGFLGCPNPAGYPYEVIKYSMENALNRLSVWRQSQNAPLRDVQLRPWLQDFNLGAVYDAKAVRSEIQAVYDASEDNFKGFMLWNSSNVYTQEALLPANSE